MPADTVAVARATPPRGFPGEGVASIACAAGIFAIVAAAQVRYTDSDPHLALLTAQALCEHGSVRLDPYVAKVPLGELTHGTWKCYTDTAGHTYYFYPSGTPLLALPAVAAARALGMDMAVRRDDARLQVLLTGAVAGGIFLVLRRLFRPFLSPAGALLLALSLSLGSSLASTLGTALWSHGPAALWVALALAEMVGAERGARARGAWLGACLFLAWLCRPTGLFLAPAALLWLFLRARGALRPALVTMASLLGAFVLFSWCQYGQLLPRYYHPAYWPGGFSPSRLGAVLASPSRGLFVFTPLLLLAFAGLLIRTVRGSLLYRLLGLAFATLVLLVARYEVWWGGWCFGPRLLTEAVPVLGVMLAMSLAGLAENERWRRGTRSVAAAAAAFGIAVHTGQGLFNPETYLWNDEPGVDDTAGGSARDWRYPQLLASAVQRETRRTELWLGPEVAPFAEAVPDGGALLFADADPRRRRILASWRRRLPRGIRIHGSLAEAEASAGPFFVPPPWEDLVREAGRHELAVVAREPTLARVLEDRGRRGEAILLAAPGGAPRLSPASIAALRALGAATGELAAGHPWVAVVERGRLVLERHDGGRPVAASWRPPGRPPIDLSSGDAATRRASILVDGREAAPRGDGMAVVSLGPGRTVRERRALDTGVPDGTGVLLYRADPSGPSARR